MKTKKLLLGAGLSLLGMIAHAQGLEKIEVEKYYVTNAADAAQADQESTENGLPTGALPAGSVTYRFYADLLPGYKVLSVYADGTRDQSMKFTTTGSFYNNPAGLFSPIPGTSKNSIKNNLLALDSYMALGGVATGNHGILKSEDNGTANNITIADNTGGVLLNNDAAIGIPLSIQDGMITAPAVISPAFLGFSADATAALTDGTVVSNTMDVVDGAMYTTTGAIGPVAGTNKVLIAQITTTNGELHYELNILVQEGTNAPENYVAKNPGAGDVVLPSLMGDLGTVIPNVPPTVNVSAPLDGASYNVGDVVTITAAAADNDGTVTSVEFFVDGVSVGVDNTAPYEASYTAVAGAHAITAIATDDDAAQTTSTVVNINVAAANIAPTVSITTPADGSSYTAGDVVAIAATAADTDGTVVSVEFLVDGVSVSTDNTAPYEATYTAVAGAHTIIAKATDDDGAQAADTVSINVTVPNNVAPTVTVTAPSDGATFNSGDAVAITATAADSDGTVTSVEFLVDGVSVGIDNTAPYEAAYTAVAGTHAIVAKATDNDGAQTADTISINVNTPPVNVAPTVAITTPSNGAVYNIGDAVAISANAADSDGTVAAVEFFVDGVSVGVDNSAPYEATYTAVAGAHSLTAKATDDDAASTTSAAVTISVVNPNGQPYTIGTITGVCTDPSFCLPVIAVDSVEDVIGYDLVLNYDATKVHATGNITLNSALINPGYASYVVNNDAAAGKINISVYLNATAPANAGFNGTGELLCVEFTKDPALAAADTVSFDISSLQESYATGVSTKLVDAGDFINTKTTLYNGSLKFWTDNSPIKYNSADPSQYLITNIYGTDANCANKSIVAVQPDTLGEFSYDIVNGSSIQIERDILPATDVQPVINGFDASLGHKVLVNDLSFIPNIYQAIALDVNADGVISAGDISQINQRSVKTITEFKQQWNYNSNGTSNGQPSKDWLFLDSTLLAGPAYKISTTYPSNDGVGFSKAKVPVVPFCLAVPVSNSASCPIYSASDYTGVLLGDVNGNYDAIPADGQLKREAAISSIGTMYMNLDQATQGVGYIDIPVSFVSTEDVVSIDLATKFNENALSFDKVVGAASYLRDVNSNVAADDKILRLTSNSAKAIETDKNIVSLRFKTLTGNVSNTDLSLVRGLLNGKQVQFELKGNITTGISTNSSGISVQAYPNPVNSILNVISPERAIVELMDLQGRQVIISTMVNANEKQEIGVENIAAGMYLLKVYNENFIITQRIVIDNIK